MFGNTISKFFKIDHLVENLTGYVETKVEIVKLEAKKEVTKGLAKAITYLLIAFVFALFIFFLSFGFAYILSEILGGLWGYGIIAAVYLILGIVLYSKKDAMIRSFEEKLSDTSKTKK